MKNLITCLLSVSILAAGAAFAGDLGTTVDPMSLGVGARPLGMGRSFVAVAENAETIMLNPAGLGSLERGKLTSMYTKLMDMANYMVLAGGMPLNDAVGIGAGVVAVTVDDIALYDIGGNSLGKASYMDSVIFLSAGVNAEKDKLLSGILPDKGKNLRLGANVKLFTKTASGADVVTSTNGSGINIDTLRPMASSDWRRLCH